MHLICLTQNVWNVNKGIDGEETLLMIENRFKINLSMVILDVFKIKIIL